MWCLPRISLDIMFWVKTKIYWSSLLFLQKRERNMLKYCFQHIEGPVICYPIWPMGDDLIFLNCTFTNDNGLLPYLKKENIIQIKEDLRDSLVLKQWCPPFETLSASVFGWLYLWFNISFFSSFLLFRQKIRHLRHLINDVQNRD